MFKKLQQVQNLLHSHQVAEMPEAIKHRNEVILTITIVSTIIISVLSFSIKGAQTALSLGFKRLSVIFLIVYFIRFLIKSTIETYLNREKAKFTEDSDSYIQASISEISNTVRGKVFRIKNGYSLIMTNDEVVFNLKDFIGHIWTFKQKVPIAVLNSVTAFLMALIILVSEFIQSGNMTLTIIFSIITFSCIVLFGVLFKFRLWVRKKFRDNHRLLKKQEEVLMNDVKHIEPLINQEFMYRVKQLLKNLSKRRKLENKETLKLDILLVLRCLVLAVFMLLIIIIKLHFAGGIDYLDIAIFTDIVAVSTVYSDILEKIASILTDLENITNTIRDAEKIKPDIDNIMTVFEYESSIEFVETEELIESVWVNSFEFTYPGTKSVYKLINPKKFKLIPGNSYNVYGPTGCGKSTFMHLLIGKIKMAVSPISYGLKCVKAYITSIMHESNGRLGSNPILQEIIFTDDVSALDRPRMIDILHGTHIYEDILRNIGLTQDDDDKVFEYLNNTSIEQYSSGQKQRLSIVKVLYNLSKKHQIVVFDEATNALDDSTAISVLKFISDYCQKDMKRIVLFVSHQVNLTKQITNGNITFIPRTTHSSEGKETIIPGTFDINVDF